MTFGQGREKKVYVWERGFTPASTRLVRVIKTCLRCIYHKSQHICSTKHPAVANPLVAGKNRKEPRSENRSFLLIRTLV